MAAAGAEPGIRRDIADMADQKIIGQLQIDESGSGEGQIGEKVCFFQLCNRLGANFSRVATGLLGGGERAIALELSQVTTLRSECFAK